jgi:hypothetical protein
MNNDCPPYSVDWDTRKGRDRLGRYVSRTTIDAWCVANGHRWTWYDDLYNPSLTTPIIYDNDGKPFRRMELTQPSRWICDTCAAEAYRYDDVIDSDNPDDHYEWTQHCWQIGYAAKMQARGVTFKPLPSWDDLISEDTRYYRM